MQKQRTLNERIQIHPDGTKERWRDVPDFESYRISDQGRVKSITRKVWNSDGYWMSKKGKLLSGGKVGTKRDHLKVCLYHTQKGKRKVKGFYIHQLVLLAFVGSCPKGMECRHKNGNGLDNRLVNIEWSTHKKNMEDKEIHGTEYRGEDHPATKLNKKAILSIRQKMNSNARSAYSSWKYKRGLSFILSKKYGVREETIRAVARSSGRYANT